MEYSAENTGATSDGQMFSWFGDSVTESILAGQLDFFEIMGAFPTSQDISDSFVPDEPVKTLQAAEPATRSTSEMNLQCEDCEKCFTHSKSLARHRKTHKPENENFTCNECSKTFSTKDALDRHKSSHDTPTHKCEQCNRYFTRKDALSRHLNVHKKKRAESAGNSSKVENAENELPSSKKQKLEPLASNSEKTNSEATEVILKESAFSSRLKTWSIKNTDGQILLQEFLNSKKDVAKELIVRELRTQQLKVNFKVFCLFKKESDKGIERKNVNFKTKNVVILLSTDLNSYYDDVVDKLVAESEDFQSKDSGWSLEEIQELEVRINKYNPLKASSYIDLPSAIKHKHAVVNVKNDDQECFRWAVLSALYPTEQNSDRVSNYKQYKNMLNFDGIEFPVNLSRVNKFEKNNSISVNVYSFDDDFKIYPLHITDFEKDAHVDLLFFRNNEHGHYCWIKILSALVSAQLSKSKVSKYICRRCLQYFHSENNLFQHREICKNHDAARVEMPTENNNQLTFKNINHSLEVPFVIYADFECLTVPASTCTPSCENSFTNIYQHHIPMSFCYYISYTHGHYKDPVVYRGLDAPKRFVEMLRTETEKIDNIYKHVEPMNTLSKEEESHHEEAKECYLCKEKFTKNDWKVHDHCHISGKYRGSSHNSCNLKYKNPKFIPVIFHNLSSYDAHIFIKELGYDEAPITLIPNNEEKYISFSKKVTDSLTLRFLDSFRFMASSLDTLSKNLSGEQFQRMKHYFPLDKLELVLRKGVYPYDYMNSLDKCDETQLPSKDTFYSLLNETNISDEDCNHAQKVWKEFGIKTLGEYSDLYVKTDVLLLCDVFENFRKLCLSAYGLDPVWYYTSPGLSWDAMLKCTKVSIELLTEYDMLLFVKKGIRGGISQCSNRFSQANNKYMDNYNPEQPSKYLLYLDSNNMYGWSMGEFLPINGFTWCDPIDVNDVPNDSPTGYILEVDMEYPSELHDQHSDLPLAPEIRVPEGCKESRLLTTLYPKEKYVLHYRNLKQCLSQGMVLKKVHRVLKFNQSLWLKPYIELNTHFRSNATSDFEKDFYKLMNNSIFGKTMENIRRRVDIKLCTKGETAEKLIAKPNFYRRTIFAENLVAIHMNRTKLVFNKPIYLGMCILDVSKTLMYDFHYGEMKKKYRGHVKLMYTDTDSFIYEITTDDVYLDMKTNIDLYDTSDYPSNNAYSIPQVNKKVPGKMKDENKGKIMTEFVGLRSKMYAFKVEGEIPVKKLKGIKKITIQNKLSFYDYKECLLKSKHFYCSMNHIKSSKHKLYSVNQNKLALCPKDKKRYILEDGVHTLAWGHYPIQ